MNKFKISTFFVSAIGFFVGCQSNNPPAPPDGAASDDSAMPHDPVLVDAALPDSGAAFDLTMPHDPASTDTSLPLDALPDSRAAMDSAMPHDLALVDAALPDGLSAVDSAMPHDLALPDATLPDGSVYFTDDSGDSVQRDAEDGPDAPAKSVIKPVGGRYAVRLDPAFANSDFGIDPINPLDKIGLWVTVDATTGLANVFFIADTDINGHIPITDGSFNYTHGYGLDGTVCPADGFAINGSFVSPTEFRGGFASIYYCSTQNRGNYIATLVVPDAGIDATVINPTPGNYSMKSDPASFNVGVDQVTPLNLSSFTISVEASTGRFWIVYVPYWWRCDEMAVVNGSFAFEHGQGLDGNGGTNCPTDGYAISGAFVSPTEAHGKYATLSSCRVQSSGTFVATFAPEVDAGE